MKSHLHFRRVSVAAVATVVALAGLVPVTATAATSTLSRGQTLVAGSALVSAGGGVSFVVQADGNAVLYGPRGPLFATGTAGVPAPARLVFQSDGNLVLVDGTNAPRWATGTYGARAATQLVVQDDGNLVAYGPNGPVWASQTTLPPPSAGPFRSPDGRFTAAMQGDGNFVLAFSARGSDTGGDALWSSGTGGHPQANLVLQSDGNLVVYDRGTPLWSTGTSGRPGAQVVMQGDGNLVLYSGGGARWASGTANAASGISAPVDNRFSLAWAHVFNDVGAPIALSSPGVGTLDDRGASVIFGDRAGAAYAYHLSDGSPVAGWPVGTGGIAVDGTPSVRGSGPSAQVFIGLGNSARPSAGGVLSVDGTGRQRWYRQLPSRPVGYGSGVTGVQGSVSIGTFAGVTGVISGAMDQMQSAFATDSGAPLNGFPWFQADSNFTTPAIANLYGTGDFIVEGGDQTRGVAFDRQYQDGGVLRVVKPTGYAGSTNPTAATVCEFNTNQVAGSSPAVGNFLAGGGIGIVGGTGNYIAGASDTTAVFALDTGCRQQWRADLDGASTASPSLVDVTGNGRNAVVVASNRGDAGGTVYALDGTTGRALWSTALPSAVLGSVTSIDLGNGYQSLIAPTPGGVFLLDGRSGAATRLSSGFGVQSSVTVTVDPNGQLGLTLVGYNYYNRGVALHYTLRNSAGRTVDGPGQWPMFHHDPQLRGTAIR